MKNALQFFIKKLRLSNPWKFKVPLLITFPYLIFLLNTGDSIYFLQPVLASVIIIVGVAGIGYLTNDLGDKEKDKIIHKANVANGLSNLKLFLLFVLFFAFALAPWYFLPVNTTTLCLFALQFFLFYAYAFKPLRLKERGLLGVIADSLYAHALPAVLAAITFYNAVNKNVSNFSAFLCLLTTWQFISGVRNILFHQVKDYNSDRDSQTNTFVTKAGVLVVENAIRKFMLPLEMLLFLAFSSFVTQLYPGFAFLVLCYWAYKIFTDGKNLSHLSYREFAIKFLDDLYTQWLPFVVLMLLCFKSVQFFPLLLLHFLLFRSEFKTRISYYLNRAKHEHSSYI